MFGFCVLSFSASAMALPRSTCGRPDAPEDSSLAELTHASVWQLLSSVSLPVDPDPVAPALRGATTLKLQFGLVGRRMLPPCVSSDTRSKPHLARSLFAWLRQARPEATATSCTVAFNRLAPLHVDRNLGPSCLTAVGRFAGGELWLADASPSGRTAPLQNQWLSFLASTPHRTLPFTGCRGYVTFYVDRSAPRTSEDTKAALTRLGVPFPEPAALQSWQTAARALAPPKVRLAAAQAKWSSFAASRPLGFAKALTTASGTWVCRGCRSWGRWTRRSKAWCSRACRLRTARALARPQQATRQTPP